MRHVDGGCLVQVNGGMTGEGNFVYVVFRRAYTSSSGGETKLVWVDMRQGGIAATVLLLTSTRVSSWRVDRRTSRNTLNCRTMLACLLHELCNAMPCHAMLRYANTMSLSFFTLGILARATKSRCNSWTTTCARRDESAPSRSHPRAA